MSPKEGELLVKTGCMERKGEGSEAVNCSHMNCDLQNYIDSNLSAYRINNPNFELQNFAPVCHLMQ